MTEPRADEDGTIRILMLEDNQADADLCTRKLRSAGLPVDVDVVKTSQEFIERAAAQVYDIVLTDYRLSHWSGLDAVHWLRSSGRDTPLILFTDTLDAELAIECLKNGVSGYVLKDNLDRLPIAVRRVLEQRKLREQRDRAEQELRKSEEQYRLLFYANPHPMWVFDSETLRFLAVNNAALQHYGYSLREFLSMTVKEIRPPEDMERFLKSADRRVDSGETYRALWRHRKKDGTVIDVEISSQPIVFGSVNAQLVLAHDVTAQRRAEAELRDNKEQLQLLLDSTAEGILGVDLQGNYTLSNSACLRMLGYDSAEVLRGKNLHRLMHHTKADGSPYPEDECPILKSLRKGVPFQLADEVFWRRDGTSFPVEYWSYPLQRDGQVVGGVVTFFDISRRRQSEESLRRSEEQYRSIIEGAPYGIFRVDKDDQVVMANPAFVALLAYENRERVVGLNAVTDIFLDSTEYRSAISAFEVGGTSTRYDTKWKRGDGTSITVRLAGRQLVDEHGNSLGFEVFVEDITERRVLQKQFEHAQRMEAVGRLAGGVAHDFNNLLMIISSYAQLLEESPSDPEMVIQYARQVREATSRAASVTRQLLAFSRKQVLEPMTLDLNNVVVDLGKMLPRLLGEDIEVVTVPALALGKVRADRGQIEQVIMNLAVNARDAMPEGGHLTIETSNVELDAQYSQRYAADVPPGNYVMLAVSDTGTGMDAEIQAHIFEPFFTTKDAGKGTGLGLATVYGIVKQSRGFIWVYSELAKGTTFKIYLPRIDVPTDTEQVSPVTKIAPGGSETILLVEDELALRLVSRVYLESKGYAILEAGNATEALKICRSYKREIQVLITDMVMPGLGGIELAKAALELRPELSIILVSGYADRTPSDDARAIGARFLQKPFSLDALARLVRARIEEPRYRKL
ncbi:MAG TPA: PAS domain S-box protein [Terriglobales bacterium]|nr:PAS domain S-box protein [Terriglobales bacterium]